MKKLLAIIFSLLLTIVLLPISVISNEVEADEINEPLTFTANTAGSTITLSNFNDPKWDGSFCTSDPTVTENWKSYTLGTEIILTNKGDKVYFKGTYQTTIDDHLEFSMGGSIAASGNIMSLCSGDGFASVKTIPYDYMFALLFNWCECLTSAPILPATTLKAGCYNAMFSGCTSLVSAPSLPATTLEAGCYNAMFDHCTSLETAPELNATTLADSCYSGMFIACSSLTEAPKLEAMTLKESCYASMFAACTGLKTAPALPATTLADGCYCAMFAECTNLETAPTILPATTLKAGCYSEMFDRCSSLTSVPSLPATTLAENCYYRMFGGCTNLVSAPALPAKTLSIGCYSVMFGGCSSLASAPSLPATTLADGCYAEMFAGCTSLTSLPSLPAKTLVDYCYGYMFGGCLDINVSETQTDLYTIPYIITGSGGEDSLAEMFEYTGGTFTGTPISNKTYYLCETPHYLTFTANENDSSITFNYESAENVFYRVNNEIWEECYSGTTVDLNENDKVQFKGINIMTSFNNHFSMNGSISASGDVTSLTNGVGGDAELSSECYAAMFLGCTGLTTAPNLPSTKLANYCYSSMFSGCTSLTSVPDLKSKTLVEGCYSYMFSGCEGLVTIPQNYLPATTLADSCYCNMFDGCKNLTSVPNLPSKTLANSCYNSMFINCTNLTKAPALPATTLADSCYGNMFAYCSKLTSTPSLPSKTLANSCYCNMFGNCTSLTSAPSLPATTLAEYCYQEMFKNCTSLVQAPSLPATNLANYCYYAMFYGCSSLTSTPVLPATTLTNNCYTSMFSGCTNLQSAPSLPATKLAESCYQEMFKNCINLVQAPSLPATTLESFCYYLMFNGCTNLEAPADMKDITTLAYRCCEKMYKDCSGLKVYENITTGYEQEWKIPNITEAEYWNKDMIKGTGGEGTFKGDPQLGKTYYIKGTTKPEPCPTPSGDDMKYDTITKSFVCTYIKGKATTTSAHIDGAEIGDAVTVRDDNRVLTNNTDYKLQDGSIRVTFQPSYLNSLSVGTHTIYINVKSTDFKVTIKVNSSPTPYVPVNTSTK